MNDTAKRLRKLATLADGEQSGLREALTQYCPDWLPKPGDAGFPNKEYTATRDPRWRKVSILVANILRRKPVDPAHIRELADMFCESHDTKNDTPNEPDPWVIVAVADCVLNRGTINRHADDPAKPYIEHTDEWGKYRIRKSRLVEYIDPAELEKYLA